MNDRFFLDTNVFVYAFDKSAPAKRARASQLIKQGVATTTGVVSYQVVQEFFNVALRRFSTPMTVAEAEQYLATVFLPMLAVHSSRSLYSEALRLAAPARLSWYDCLIVAAAIQAECSLLFSEDLQHGRRFGSVRIENPFT